MHDFEIARAILQVAHIVKSRATVAMTRGLES